MGPDLELGLGLDLGLWLLLRAWGEWRWASLVCLWLSPLVLVGYLRDMAFSDGNICVGTNLLGGGTFHSHPL